LEENSGFCCSPVLSSAENPRLIINQAVQPWKFRVATTKKTGSKLEGKTEPDQLPAMAVATGTGWRQNPEPRHRIPAATTVGTWTVHLGCFSLGRLHSSRQLSRCPEKPPLRLDHGTMLLLSEHIATCSLVSPRPVAFSLDIPHIQCVQGTRARRRAQPHIRTISFAHGKRLNMEILSTGGHPKCTAQPSPAHIPVPQQRATERRIPARVFNICIEGIGNIVRTEPGKQRASSPPNRVV
jgi:hypothetical protein